MRKVPLGLAYLAACLEEQGIYVEAYNLNVDDINQVDFTKFEFVGISCLTPFISIINEMCEHIHAHNPSIKVIVGGPHPTFQTEEIFDQIPAITYAVVGEGEEAFPRLVLDEENAPNIPGVHYRDSGGKVCGSPVKRVDIHSIPYPSQRIFDHGQLEKRNPFRAILGSRGCPFRCRNCQPILKMVQPYRTRRVENVIAEIVHLQETYGQTYFGFIDAELPVKKSWFEDFYSEIKGRKIDFAFHCNGRSDLLDGDLLKMIKDMNVSRLAIGVESGVQRVIDDVLLKGIDLEQTYEIFKEATGIGIRTHGHFMIGIPGETLDDMRATLEFAKNLPSTSIEFNMLTPWPGTDFYKICEKNNFIAVQDLSEFNEKKMATITTGDFTNEQVHGFYGEIRETLTSVGWRNSDDGSVYYRPEYRGVIF